MLTLRVHGDDRLYMVLPDGRVVRIICEFVQNRLMKVNFDAPQDVRIYREKAIQKALADQQAAVKLVVACAMIETAVAT